MEMAAHVHTEREWWLVQDGKWKKAGERATKKASSDAAMAVKAACKKLDAAKTADAAANIRTAVLKAARRAVAVAVMCDSKPLVDAAMEKFVTCDQKWKSGHKEARKREVCKKASMHPCNHSCAHESVRKGLHVRARRNMPCWLQDKLIPKVAKRAAKKAERKEARRLGGILRKADQEPDALKQQALVAELTAQCKATVVKEAMAAKLSSNNFKTLESKADRFMAVAEQKALKAAAKLKREAADSVTKARQEARMTKAKILSNAKAATFWAGGNAKIEAAAKRDANKSAQKVRRLVCCMRKHKIACTALPYIAKRSTRRAHATACGAL